VFDFITDGATPFLVHFPRLLLHWLNIRLDGELVTDEFRINFRHIGRGSREYVIIF